MKTLILATAGPALTPRVDAVTGKVLENSLEGAHPD
jgi:hypothetical protein